MGNIISDVFLIDEEYVKTYSTISDNLDSKYLNPCIVKSQVMDLQALIGTKLTVKICTLVRDEEIAGTPYETLLTEYIQPYLLQCTQAELLISNFAKQRNAGNMQYIDTNQSNITMNDMWKLHAHYDNNASFFANRLTDYILANHTKFPEYCKVSNKGEMHAHRNDSQHSGWVL